MVLIVFVLAAMRRIVNKVLYIRGGKTFEYKPCRVEGTNIKFKANPTQRPVTVPIVSDPYIQFAGFFARRIYVVVEGSGQTSRFPDSIIGPALKVENVRREYRDKKTGEIYTKDILQTSIIQHVPAVGAQNPQLTVASSSIAYFEQGVGSLAASLPKGATSIFMNIIFLIVGFLGGVAWGNLLLH